MFSKFIGYKVLELVLVMGVKTPGVLVLVSILRLVSFLMSFFWFKSEFLFCMFLFGIDLVLGFRLSFILS